MSNLLWLRQQLARFTYRPGWRWEIVEDGVVFAGGGYRLVVRYVALDTYQPTRDTRLTTVRELPEFIGADEDRFAHWLQHVLFDIERHESQEWLRRDGAIYDDPHKPGGR